MTEVPTVLLYAYTGTLLLSAWFIFRQSRDIRKTSKLVMFLSTALHECNDVVQAISARGNLVCDECHEPIAPMTPTTIEKGENDWWTIAHRTCPVTPQ